MKTSHLFFDSTLNTWRLITEKLPEKPTNIMLNSMAWKAYYTAIAALKQNALTVGNEELVKSTMPYGYNLMKERGNICEWSGGYETKEILYGVHFHAGLGWFKKEEIDKMVEVNESKTVALLTLPEEKKNTMENLTKETFAERRNKAIKMSDEELINRCNEWVNSLAGSGGKSWVLSIPVRYDKDPDMLFTELAERLKTRNSELASSGSVAAPKEDTERIFSGTPEEILDSLESTGDAYYHHSQLEPVITLLQSELAAAKEEVKYLKSVIALMTKTIKTE